MRLLAGVSLLLIGTYISLLTVHGLSSLLHREAAVKAIPQQKTPSNPDDVTEAARLRVYGVLAPHDDPPSEDDATAPRTTGPSSALDHVHASPDGGPQHLLHSRLTLRSYQGFSFVVPAHALRPMLTGTFKSPGNGRDSANTEVMLLHPQEFEDLVRHQEGTASFSTDGPDGEVDWTLSPTFGEAQEYYLVFRNASEKSAEIVDVDFTIGLQ